MTSIEKIRILGNLALIRSRTAWIADDYYEDKTEVWTFGDTKGYTEFSTLLKSVHSGGKTLSVIGRVKYGMLLLLIPSSSDEFRSPRIRVFERIVFRNHKPRMELIIHGNTSGFRKLAEHIDYLLTHSPNQPEDHIHIDDWNDKWVTKRSVSLNIRGPVNQWTRQSLREYHSFITSPSKYHMPEDIDYLTEESMSNEVPVCGESVFLKLRNSCRP